ncbi:MAG: DUF4129 domain-containing protein [Frankiaceae bacterium]|nr:DUF4129 domain-containing protein [Frankiaceae bacterium]MBV9869156.1 DUF4129 domain-containing protein [Frankiaceae bacterium]
MVARPPITRGGAQNDARHELSKAIYHRQSDPWPVRAVRWVGHQLDHILSKALDAAPAGNIGALALVLLLVIIVGLLVWRVGVPRRVASIGAVLSPTSTRSAAEHRQLSERAAASADYATAVLERMRAITRELEERGVLDDRAGRTATEVATDAGPRLGSVADDLPAAAQTFNDVVYGEVPADARLLDVLIRADDRVRSGSRTMVAVT